jgi:hypothetical protein
MYICEAEASRVHKWNKKSYEKRGNSSSLSKPITAVHVIFGVPINYYTRNGRSAVSRFLRSCIYVCVTMSELSARATALPYHF